MNDHMMAEAEQIVSTPKTISPKDALLDLPEPEDEASKMSLFGSEQHYGNSSGHQQTGPLHTSTAYTGTKATEDHSYDLGSGRREREAESLRNVGAFSYQQSPQIQILPSSFPYHTQSLESSSMNAPVMMEYAKPSPRLTKPEGAKAETGAYTCTAPGCQQRFTTTSKLQKHRRDNHHQPTSGGSVGMTSTLHGSFSNRHQGPHRCTRISPTTGKPCNTIFSRPYDLTRHEDTIHNTSREKVRCEICNDEKTFSRQDALTRHKKVKHGIDK